jgi:hypothetical protein
VPPRFGEPSAATAEPAAASPNTSPNKSIAAQKWERHTICVLSLVVFVERFNVDDR